jgi:hypothetical protein
MTNLKSTARKIGLVTIASIFALSFVGLSFVSASAQQTPEYLISINISCFNPSFCGPSFTETVGATAYWGGHQVTVISDTQWNANGHVAYSYSTTWVGTWKVGTDGDFITAGLNTTTVVVGHHATTTHKHFANYDTTTPATPISLNCAEFFGAPCPAGVSAEMTVTAVPKA